MDIEKKLLYTKDHEWINIENDYAFIGITDYAQSELGDIIFVELPEINDSFEIMDTFGTLEAVKTVADLFSPIKCKIIDVNNNIDSRPETINSDPYGEGWILKVKVENKDDLNDLLSYNEYSKIIDNG